MRRESRDCAAVTNLGDTWMRASLAMLACWIAAPATHAADSAARSRQVETIVTAISPQRIEARIRKLASFHTRHTLSETASETRGIGAARRWIKAELEACSKAAGGALKVAFDAFTP